jgi:hypothetical protein
MTSMVFTPDNLMHPLIGYAEGAHQVGLGFACLKTCHYDLIAFLDEKGRVRGLWEYMQPPEYAGNGQCHWL